MVKPLKKFETFMTDTVFVGSKSMKCHKALFIVLVTIFTIPGIAASQDPVLTGEIFAEDSEGLTVENQSPVQDSSAAPKGEIYAIGEEIEWRERVKGGICGVFNPETVEIEWMEQNKGGVAGVYNPLTKEIEWRQKYNSGVAGIFNPATEEIEWKENYKGGIAAVYNPSTRQIEWKQ